MAAKTPSSSSSPGEGNFNKDLPLIVEPSTPTLKFPVIGMGASAGGLDAFKRFFSAMPSDSGMAFVLVPHLDPSHRSLMVELLTRESEMKVCEVEDEMPIEKNRIYIIPPNSDLVAANGRLHLSKIEERQAFASTLNDFFRSLAHDQREMSIGIILSGTGSHGTHGLKTVKSLGGMVMAQDPDSCEYEDMPRSAIEAGLVDYVLPPEKMPEAIRKYVRQACLHAEHAAPETNTDEEQITPVLDLLRLSRRNDFRCYRKSMLIRRIQRRMAICQIEAVHDYVEYLRSHPEELLNLNRDLLIGVTSFFRDPDVFQVLQKQVIPGLIEQQSGDIPLRIWVPACSTGEEAYSIAILLIEQFNEAGKPPHFKIFASDIDEESLDIARRGVYTASAISEMSSTRLDRFFIKADNNHYQVIPQLRESIVVNGQNLISDAPFSKLDLISCRNLLIYMKPELQQKIISLFHFSLNQRGFLVLGSSESIGRQSDLFEAVSKKWNIYRRTGPTRHDLVQIPIAGNQKRRFQFPGYQASPRPRLSLSELVQKMLLARYAPAAVLINRKYEVLSLFGHTSDFLELPSGELTRDLMTLVRQGLRSKIRAACQQALKGTDLLVITEARVIRNERSSACTVTVTLLHEPKEADGLLLITFEERSKDFQPQIPQIPLTIDQSALMRQLENEVETTRADLQSTIEDQQSSNEEVMSMNEELQSANEELETSKEELQSLNEELSTMNSQLHDKVEELERSNSDFRNFLTSSQIATVFLGTDLCIRRFTPFTAQLFHLIDADIGRPIRDFSLRFTDPTLLQDAKKVLDSKVPLEVEIRSDEGQYYLRRIHPYYTSDNHVEGVVLTFVDISSRVEEESKTQRLAAVLRDSNDAVMLLDTNSRVTSWNRGAERLYGYTAQEAFELSLTDFIPADQQEQMGELLQRIARGEDIESLEVPQITKLGEKLDVLWTITCLRDPGGRPVTIAVTSRDITERKRIENALAENERRMRAILDTASDAIVTIGERGVIEHFNPAAERMFGYSSGEAIGQNVQILMPLPYREEHDNHLSRYLATGVARIIGVGREIVGQRKDGSMFPIDLAISEHRDGSQQLFTGIIRDISERKALQREVLSIAAEEHRRIGQDLHDNVGQKLTGLGMLAGSLEETLQQNSPSDSKLAHRIASGLEEALVQVRSLSKGLVPVEVDAEGLRAALAQLAETLTVDSGVDCHFDCDQTVRIGDNDTANHVYRIAQEAVTNALRHASPRHVNISLIGNASRLSLSVQDDGKGIASSTVHLLGIGLKTMQYRATLIGATLSITSVKGGGTLVICRLAEKAKHEKSFKDSK